MSLLEREKMFVKQNRTTHVTMPPQGRESCTICPAGLLSGLEARARRWAVPSVVLNLLLSIILIVVLIAVSALLSTGSTLTLPVYKSHPHSPKVQTLAELVGFTGMRIQGFLKATLLLLREWIQWVHYSEKLFKNSAHYTKWSSDPSEPATLPAKKSELCPAGPACPDGWIGYLGKCYYFSQAEGDWTYSQNNCSALGASLAVIDTQQEMDFLLRYRGRFYHWIGLQREPDQPWMWTNGTEFNNWFTIVGGGLCAFVNNDEIASSGCSREGHWICSKPAE